MESGFRGGFLHSQDLQLGLSDPQFPSSIKWRHQNNCPTNFVGVVWLSQETRMRNCCVIGHRQASLGHVVGDVDRYCQPPRTMLEQ